MEKLPFRFTFVTDDVDSEFQEFFEYAEDPDDLEDDNDYSEAPKGHSIMNVFFFNIEPTTEQQHELNTETYLEDSGFYEFIHENEGNYGIHEVNFLPPFLYGFNSFEVSENKQADCFENIRGFFMAKGYHCSETEVYNWVTDEQDCEDEYLHKHKILLPSLWSAISAHRPAL